MPDTTWVILEKDKKIHKYKMIDNAHLFDKNLMNLQIEGWNTDVEMNYDDIICIKTENYLKEKIDDMSKTMMELEIRNSRLKEVPLFTDKIRKIQLVNSEIDIDDAKIAELHLLYPKAKLIITKFEIDIMKRDYTNPIPTIQQHYGNANWDIPDPQFNHLQERNVLNSTQTVHLTSVNVGVIKGIEIIKAESKKYTLVNNAVGKLLEPPSTKKPAEHPQSSYANYMQFIKFIGKIFYDAEKSKKIQLENAIRVWYDDPLKHSIHRLSFKELFDMILTIIENHPQKEDMKERLVMELSDSIGLCFLGRINRMVNSLIGFVDGIFIGLSVKEEVQMKIEIIVNKLIAEKIKKKEAIAEMTELFKDVGEKDNITEDFKRANIDALQDFDDEDDADAIPQLTQKQLQQTTTEPTFEPPTIEDIEQQF
jgi:hypothetical protein